MCYRKCSRVPAILSKDVGTMASLTGQEEQEAYPLLDYHSNV